MTVSSTITLTQSPAHSRRRRLSLSLISASAPPPLLNLPAELVFNILGRCLRENKASDIASICQTIRIFAEILLYRTVVLDSQDKVDLFHRTTLSKSSSFLTSHVKNLVLTWAPTPESQQFRRTTNILSSCNGVRSLTLPAGYDMNTVSGLVHAVRGDALVDLIIQSHDGHSPFRLPKIVWEQPPDCALSLTHLRICEPGEGFVSPAALLASFGDLPNLTHLQVSRRVYSNENNDQVFVDDLREILETRPTLRTLAVTIFPMRWSVPAQDVTESSIWNMVTDVSKEESRLVVVPGEYKEWTVEGKGLRRATFGDEPANMWASLRSRQVAL